MPPCCRSSGGATSPPRSSPGTAAARARSSSTRASRSPSTRRPTGPASASTTTTSSEWHKTQRPCGDDIEAEVKRRDRSGSRPSTQAPPRGADPVRRRRRRPGPAARHDIGDLRDMTDTVLSSATREVVIGFDRPFVIIGERINPTGRKLLAEEMKAGDFSRVERDVLAQVEAGAHMLDVNAGIPLADEPAILARTIQLVQCLTDLPLSIDSSIVEALEAGPRGLPGQGARQLGDRRGGAPRARPAARQEVRRRGRRDQQRRHRDQRGPRRPVRGRQADRRAGRRPRHPALGHRRRPAGHADRGAAPRPAGRCSSSSAGCATSSRSTRPAAPRTSASGCRTARASTPPSCRWRSPPA